MTDLTDRLKAIEDKAREAARIVSHEESRILIALVRELAAVVTEIADRALVLKTETYLAYRAETQRFAEAVRRELNDQTGQTQQNEASQVAQKA